MVSVALNAASLALIDSGMYIYIHVYVYHSTLCCIQNAVYVIVLHVYVYSNMLTHILITFI
jgi:hypothetical protein